LKLDKFKVTPILETGLTIDYEPKKNPVKKKCHLHLRWAIEKCPICNSALIIYYAPTAKHQSGIGAALPEQEHKIVVSCVNCGLMNEISI